MHQIYSCSDENLEVFTVISSKSCSPVRRKAKSIHCMLPKKAESDCHLQRREELQAQQDGFIHAFCKEEDGQGFSCLQNRHQGFFSSSAKYSVMHTTIAKQKSFCYSNNQPDAKTSQLWTSPISHSITNRMSAVGPAMKDGVFVEQNGRLTRKNTEDDVSPIQEMEASSPLTGSTLYGTPSLLRKMWMKHKKKSEYLGATNSAFEAD
uniref:Vexin n=1 Tax=Salvator merianae TaxID=96440 RepID=A0A8D0DMJ8_SALMN